jgi:hypothetical protein
MMNEGGRRVRNEVEGLRPKKKKKKALVRGFECLLSGGQIDFGVTLRVGNQACYEVEFRVDSWSGAQQ